MLLWHFLMKNKSGNLVFKITMRQNLSWVVAGVILSMTLVSCTSAKPSVIKNSKKNSIRPKIALVLGGGGAKGFAHVGVIKVLESHGIQPHIITGTSSGSLVGSLYASGKTAKELELIATSVTNEELLDITLSKQGFIEGIKLKNWVNQQVKGKKIEQLPIKFACIATDLTDNSKVVLNKGDTGLAVQASSSIRNVFIPPRINNRRHADGGLTSLIPVKTAQEMGADIIIAVDISAPAKTDKELDFWAVLDQNLNVMPKQKQAELALADVVISPEVGHIGTTDMINREETIQAGEVATRAKIGEIKQKIAKYQQLNKITVATATVH